MSWSIVDRIWESGLEAHEKAVMAPTAKYGDDGGRRCRPSAKRIANMASLSDRQVRRVWSRMRAIGVMEIVKKASGQVATEYRIHVDKLPERDDTDVNPQQPTLDADVNPTHDTHVTPDMDVKGTPTRETPDTGVTPDVDVTPDTHVKGGMTPTSVTHDTHVNHNGQEWSYSGQEEEEGPSVDDKLEDWHYEFADASYERLHSLGKIRRRLTEKQRRDWAHVFRILNTSKRHGHSKDVIAAVMDWLLQPGNWWMQSNNFRSVMKLLEPDKQAPEQTYFERFLVDMKSDRSRQPNRKRNRHNQTADELDREAEGALDILRQFS